MKEFGYLDSRTFIDDGLYEYEYWLDEVFFSYPFWSSPWICPWSVMFLLPSLERESMPCFHLAAAFPSIKSWHEDLVCLHSSLVLATSRSVKLASSWFPLCCACDSSALITNV